VSDHLHDVIVLGGGLAGLTLALQLRKSCPSASIRVLERRAKPAPDATHKIGESTVEIGAYYFGTILGLEQHLRERQLRKFGFRFFSSDRHGAIDDVQEIGVSRYLSVTSYQIDRGIFENFLLAHAREAGVEVDTGSIVEEVVLGNGGAAHEVVVHAAGASRRLRARWVVDASGRTALLKRKLGLAEPTGHEVNAAWFRVPLKIDVEDWSNDSDWLGRCEPRQRWRSTNHLVGDGYWVWLIPLSSGYHSIGIVADAERHPMATMNSFPRTLAWLDLHQPRLSQALREAGAAPADFAFLKNFSYGCRDVFSADRWAISGEAGVFLDPFYSPGSDFIAIANTYIVDLVRRDLAGEHMAAYVSIYSQLFRSFYESTLTLYKGQYGVFAHPEALSVKVIWDYTYYWGVLCQLFFQQRLTDLRMLGRVRDDLLRMRHLNEAAQPFVRRWATATGSANPPRLLDQAALPWFDALNKSLTDTLDDAGFVARIRASRAQLESLAAEICGRAIAADAAVAAWPETLELLARAGQPPAPAGSLLAYPLSA
jgi:flavin-dependent dehydrogenase